MKQVLFRLLLGSFLLSSSHITNAEPWQFGTPIEITKTHGMGIFHHLESAGRRSLAVSENTVAVTWEDDHEGQPSVYLALKEKNELKFGDAIKISASGEAYEPGIAALPGGRFALVWEENEHLYARIAGAEQMGVALRLGDAASGQASLLVQDEKLFVVASERSKRHGRIMLHQLQVNSVVELTTAQHCFVDPAAPEQEQQYPVISTSGKQLVVAWEDRRPGHTIIVAAQSNEQNSCQFSAPMRISEEPEGPQAVYGAGHGVTRVAMANFASDSLFAVWSDKRNFREGYDIYGSAKKAGSAFTTNVKVQDDFGVEYRQLHSTLSGHTDGQLAVAWSDDREGSMDIWLSWLEDGAWSDDIAIPGASGSGEQAHGGLFIDVQGDLHIAWIDRPEVGGATRLKYLFGKADR